MKDSNNDVNEALDDIFGADTIDINVTGEEENTPSYDEDLYPPENTLFVDKDEALFSGEFYEPGSENTLLNGDGLMNQPAWPDDNTNFVNSSDDSKTQVSTESSDATPSNQMSKKKRKKVRIKGVNVKKELPVNLIKFLPNKGNVIYFGGGIVLVFLVLFLLFKFVFVGEKVLTCTFKASDEGYELTDVYKITHRKNKVKYVDGTYKYTTKSEAYKAQLPILKEAKLPVILNSNGMPGFTYLYEIGSEHFTVSSYLDFTLFDFEKIDKNNNDVTPISYFPISSKTTYKSLKEHLEKEGYSCVNGK